MAKMVNLKNVWMNCLVLGLIASVPMACSSQPSGESSDYREEFSDADRRKIQEVYEDQFRLQSAMNMFVLQGGARFAAEENDNVFPPSIGHIIVDNFATIDCIVQPQSSVRDPHEFHKWERAKQIEWVNTHSDYIYFLSGVSYTKDQRGLPNLDSDRVSFLESPTEDDAHVVTLCFMDQHYEFWPYDEADKLIKKQTGHTIAQWMKSTSPGTGELGVPQDDAAEGQ